MPQLVEQHGLSARVCAHKLSALLHEPPLSIAASQLHGQKSVSLGRIPRRLRRRKVRLSKRIHNTPLLAAGYLFHVQRTAQLTQNFFKNGPGISQVTSRPLGWLMMSPALM